MEDKIDVTARQALAIAAVIQFTRLADNDTCEKLIAWAKETYPGIEEVSVERMEEWAEEVDDEDVIYTFKNIINDIILGGVI